MYVTMRNLTYQKLNNYSFYILFSLTFLQPALDITPLFVTSTTIELCLGKYFFPAQPEGFLSMETSDVK